MKISYEKRIGEDGEAVLGPIIPPDATVEEIVAAEGAAVMTDEQAAALSAHLAEGVTPEGEAQ